VRPLSVVGATVPSMGKDDLWFADSGESGDLTLSQVCANLEDKLHRCFDNQKPPESFVDWQSYARDRDKTVFEIAGAVVTLARMVDTVAAKQASNG
jgi:hypothetical protein